MEKRIAYYRLDDTEVGDLGCPFAHCDKVAFMWGTLALDGYVDACYDHAARALADAIGVAYDENAWWTMEREPEEDRHGED